LNIEDRNKIKKYIKRSKSISDSLDAYKPDVVIAFITQEMLWAGLKGKYRIVYSERTNPAAKSRKLQIITEWLYRRAYKVVFQTSGARDFFCAKIHDKSAIIANPIKMNLPLWKDYEHEKTIITACRITPEKNLKMLIRAFSNFHKSHKDYLLKIYGEPRNQKAKQELIDLAENLGVRQFVEFPGYSRDIHQEMARSTIFTLTSNYEGLSNSMLEALCIGVPTICTDCPSGGAAMFIRESENGFLVSINDSEALSKKLTQLVDDGNLQEKVSTEAVKLRELLSIDQIVNQWLEVIK
jgi:glycosyltransferase involved in cell wall biosynthesis